MQSNIVEKIITKNKIDAILEYAKPSAMMKRNFQTARQRSVGQGTTARKVGTPMKTSAFKKAQDSTITKAKAGDQRAQGALSRGAFTSTSSTTNRAAGDTRQTRLDRVARGRKKQQMVAKAKTVGVDVAKGIARKAGTSVADYAQEKGRRARQRMNTNMSGEPVGQKVAQSAADKAYDSLRSAMSGKDKKDDLVLDRSTISSSKTRKEGTMNHWKNSLAEAVESGKIEREKMMSGEQPPAKKKKEEHSVIDAITGINRG